MIGQHVPRRAALGIDAAWTATEPSGVAHAVETEAGRRLAAVEASDQCFLARVEGRELGGERPSGSKPTAAALLAAAQKLSGRRVDLVAVDMPLSLDPILRRRPCDEAVSKTYGAKGAAVHSPSAARPGRIADALRAEFEALGYGLCVRPPARGLIEVYPHAALIEFVSAPRRLKYKAGKIGAYWPEFSSADRHVKLRAVWARIVEMLDRRIAGAAERLPLPQSEVRGWRLKAYEDKLDAVVCAAVAVACLDGKAIAHGDERAAIWVPAGDCADAVAL